MKQTFLLALLCTSVVAHVVAQQRITVGGSVQSAKLVSRVPAQYPALARDARIQGVVRFDVLIDVDGHVKDIKVVSGHPLLVPSSLDAVKQWAYQPTLLNGQPVEVATTVDVNFVLSGMEAPATTS